MRTEKDSALLSLGISSRFVSIIPEAQRHTLLMNGTLAMGADPEHIAAVRP